MSDDDPPRKLGLQDAYGLETPDDNRALYRDWAETYEQDFIQPRGYVYHRNVVAVFATLDPVRSEPVLDVGCGTGIVGVELAAAGFTEVDGIDISPEMLREAGRKSVYRDLIVGDLTTTISPADRSYRGIVSVGTFTHGHLGPESLGELLRVGDVGCRYAIGVNAEHYQSRGFARWFEIATARGVIDEPHIESVVIYEAADDDHRDDRANVVCFSKLVAD